MKPAIKFAGKCESGVFIQADAKLNLVRSTKPHNAQKNHRFRQRHCNNRSAQIHTFEFSVNGLGLISKKDFSVYVKFGATELRKRFPAFYGSWELKSVRNFI